MFRYVHHMTLLRRMDYLYIMVTVISWYFCPSDTVLNDFININLFNAQKINTQQSYYPDFVE